jgi:hypothetical protein
LSPKKRAARSLARAGIRKRVGIQRRMFGA